MPTPEIRSAGRMSRHQRLVLAIAILASFVAFLDGSVVNVALPAMTGELGGGLGVQQWVVDAYLITLGSLILLAGSLSDAFGRFRILRIGLIGFGVASLLCAVAPTAESLIVARLLQGGAAALLVPSSLAIIISTFSGPAQGRAIGTWTAWTGAAGITGPLLGGILVDTASWRLIFAINVVPIIVTVWLMSRAGGDERPARDHRPKVDVVGATLGAVGLGGPVFALIEQGRYGWSSPALLAPLVVGLLSLAAFVWWEHRHENPMLPLGLFRVRNFGFGNIATLFIYGALSVGFFSIAVFVQQIAGFSATAAGLATLPSTLVMLALSPLFGRLAGRFGPRSFMSIGPVIAGLGFLLTATADAEVDYWLQLFPGILLIGLGLAVTVAPLTSGILGSIDPARAGIGSAVNNAVSRVAGLVSIALVGVVAGGSLGEQGFGRVVGLAAVLMLAGGIVSFVGIRNPRTPSSAAVPHVAAHTVRS
ncbi:DHA2 family efflux MFS transporter permease subunit [Herbiconiux ginsengi]|uniref:Drug resistance transporter, EmrB/QacA subfamily n=1 Tax=Herbiconiux ginsengi TaxID=381665 RepID=A0A1H3SZD7_9MICO|nr:DHA2 family efflux MFS transporter permease subunit [Herbiconiux ginsengi]SDZ43047.1 drug resistance transporter, EmrB/QacA subfamily [Herbiconiux ginsengi]